MTAILDDIRRLETAHARGEINAAELAAAKADLFDAIPDVTETAREPKPRTAPRKPPSRLGQALLLCAFVLTLCASATLFITGDLMLTTTVSITVLAALTVTMFRQLDG
ncbi:SHOCT domain-containing protein [uncultured Tateyamaria sp.]|uniref:SHOCT domain-containing protein n=1 Tax=uncultured Tateyamaria sp. TaxID=455651 RepID=UPI00261EE949|nr:SHOCT domain-containing protein [uncultured Tateyamaria sp.]